MGTIPRYLLFYEALAIARCSESALRDAIKNNELDFPKRANRRVVTEEALLRWMNGHRNGGSQVKKLLNLGLLRRKVFLALPPVSNVVYRQMKSPWERITILMTSLDRGAKDLADLDTVIEWLRNCLEIALAARVTIIEDRAALEQIFPLPFRVVRPEQLQIAQDNA